jgi:predicted small secreted protein
MVTNKFAPMLVALLVLAGGGIALSACNTTEGFGEDLESAGEAINEEAEDAQN